MKRKRNFNVSKDMYPWLCNIFARDGQKYKTGYKKDGYIVSLDVTGLDSHVPTRWHQPEFCFVRAAQFG